MRKVLLASLIAVSFISPVSSFADSNVFGVRLPVEKQVVNSNVIAGSYVETDSFLANTLVPQKLTGPENKNIKGVAVKGFYVFGVDLNSVNKI